MLVPATDTVTQAIAAGGSGGFLFLVARWLWHYEQVVTNRYEKQIESNSKRIDLLETELDNERRARYNAQEEQARLTRLLTQNGIDTRARVDGQQGMVHDHEKRMQEKEIPQSD